MAAGPRLPPMAPWSLLFQISIGTVEMDAGLALLKVIGEKSRVIYHLPEQVIEPLVVDNRTSPGGSG